MANKIDLAYHYGQPHRAADGKIVHSVEWLTKVLRWRKEEIESAHRSMHERIGTPIEPEYREVQA